MSRYRIDKGVQYVLLKGITVVVLAQVGDETTVLTTNYDKLAERILSNRVGITHRTKGRTATLTQACHGRLLPGPRAS